MLNQTKAGFAITVEKLFAGTTFGIDKGDRKHVVAEPLHLPDGDSLIGQQPVENASDGDVFQLNHDEKMSVSFVIVKPVICRYPD